MWPFWLSLDLASGKSEQVISKKEESEVKVFIPLASSLLSFFPRTGQYIRKCQLRIDNAIRLYVEQTQDALEELS